MKIVCISDTHGINEPSELPDGDVLIHAGDLSLCGDPHEVQHGLGWLRKLPHKHKIVIGGNHDNALAEFVYLFDDQLKPYKDCAPLTLLRGSFVDVEGLRIFGSSALPFNPIYRPGARAYMLDGTTFRHWNYAPPCDILVTHGAPKGVLDMGCGDPHLRAYVDQVKPMLHVFGHIHLGRGVADVGSTKFVNAAMLDDSYRPVHEPIVVEI